MGIEILLVDGDEHKRIDAQRQLSLMIGTATWRRRYRWSENAASPWKLTAAFSRYNAI